MKLMIGEYEVEIEARHLCRTGFSEEGTLRFLSEVMIAMYAEERLAKEDGLPYTSKFFSQMCIDIGNALEAQGFYER